MTASESAAFVPEPLKSAVHFSSTISKLPPDTSRPFALSIWRKLGGWTVFWLLLLGWPLLAAGNLPVETGQSDPVLFGDRLTTYILSGGLLWIVLALVLVGQRLERGPFSALGFVRLRWTDPGVAVLFLVAANLLLNGLGIVIRALGLEVPDQVVEALLPTTGIERVAWIALSVSAGICEESCFRGFLLVRSCRLTRSWVWASVLASLSFGLTHAYQGWGGVILISCYGFMFCVLRLASGSLWPGIWAHIGQDLAAMFMI